MSEAKSTSKVRQGWDQSSTCVALEETGRAEGKAYGLAEAVSRTSSQILRRQAEQKFGGPDPGATATLDGLAQAFACQLLEELAEHLITATTRSEWLAGMVVPAPGMPDYAKDIEVDLEPASPSIDTYAKVAMMGGEGMVVHLRLQKWFQPDLDRVLFDSMRMLERKYGSKVMVLVIMMWPSAEGPGITGKFVDRDAKGRPQRTFTYQIKRAWELEPEAAMQSPGTMLLAPLTRGAKQRMPEIVRMLKEEMKRHALDGETQQMIWESVYWSMGISCEAAEVHRLLADVMPLIESSRNYRGAKSEAYLEGFSEGQRDGPAMAARNLVLRQGSCRFGPREGSAEALARISSMDELNAIVRRVLSAPDWPSVLEGK